MDEDYTIDDRYEYPDGDEYIATVCGKLVVRIIANDFDEAYRIMDGEFKDGAISANCFVDTLSIVRVGTVADESGRHRYSNCDHHFKYEYEFIMEMECGARCTETDASDIEDELDRIMEEKCLPRAPNVCEWYFAETYVERID